MTTGLIKAYCILEPDSLEVMRNAYDRIGFSARSFDKLLRVARTLADLEGSSMIRKKDILHSLNARGQQEL
jgi:magnesium chelatase family protein